MAYQVIKERNRVYIQGNSQEIKKLKGILSSNGLEFSKVIQNHPTLGLMDWLKLAGTWTSIVLSVAKFLYQILSSRGLENKLKKELRKALRKRKRKK